MYVPDAGVLCLSIARPTIIVWFGWGGKPLIVTYRKTPDVLAALVVSFTSTGVFFCVEPR